MRTRNGIVADTLRRKYYQDQPEGSTVPVFCASNTMYWEHRENPKEQATPYLLLSGIPELRKHCIAIVAESQLRAARRYMANDIPAHIGAVQLWIQSGAGSITGEQKAAVRQVLDEVDRGLERVSKLGKLDATLLMARDRS